MGIKILEADFIETILQFSNIFTGILWDCINGHFDRRLRIQFQANQLDSILLDATIFGLGQLCHSRQLQHLADE